MTARDYQAIIDRLEKSRGDIKIKIGNSEKDIDCIDVYEIRLCLEHDGLHVDCKTWRNRNDPVNDLVTSKIYALDNRVYAKIEADGETVLCDGEAYVYYGRILMDDLGIFPDACFPTKLCFDILFRIEEV